jgi:hypothetical protein
MVFNATFNNISVISWRSVLLVEESGMELPDIIKHAAQELEENIVDVNGVDQIGNLVI